MRGNLFRGGAIAVAVVAVIALGIPSIAPASAATTISPIIRTPGADLTAPWTIDAPATDLATSVGFAWHTAQTASSSTPQPDTRLVIGPAESFDCAAADWASAETPVISDYDRIRYSRVTVGNLQPGTAYSYCVRSADGDASPTATFTMPAADPDSVTFLAFADANWRSTPSYQNNFANTVAQALDTYPDAVFATHNGATGSALDRSHWEGFVTSTASGASSWPITWAPTPLSGDDSLNRYFTYGNALRTTTAASLDTANYAVREGCLLLLVINTHLNDSASQNNTVAWIEQQVNALGPDRDNTWVVASVPNQFYATSTPSATHNTMKQAFRDNGVSLVLQGGAATYTRSLPVSGANGQDVWNDYPGTTSIATADGTVYVNPGASGIAQTSISPGSSAVSATSGWLAAWTPTLSSTDQLSAGSKSYSAITVTGDELHVTALTAGGDQIDDFTIHRGATPEYQIGTLSPYGLNNGFGVAGAKTSRTVTWMGLDSVGYANPYYRIIPEGGNVDASSPVSMGCSSLPLPSTATDYTAYTCEITGLEEGTTYTYKVGAYVGQRPYESTEYTFATEGDEEFTFIDFADSQSGSASQYDPWWGNTLRTALENHPEAVLATHTGDITDTSSFTGHVQPWLDTVGDSLSGIAFNPVLGNHDVPNSAMWDAIFPRSSVIPRPTEAQYGATTALEYAQVYGNALLIHINTNPDVPSINQLRVTADWVRSTVAQHGKNPNGSDRFIIVFEHKSPFGGTHSGTGSYPTGDYGNPNIVQVLPEVFDEVGVDLVLAGHDHNLIRSLPITWDVDTNRAVWDRSQADVTEINSDDDGLVYYIPRNSGEKTYSLIPAPSATSSPWVAWNWRLSTNYDDPGNTVYSVVAVSKTKITVNTYRTGDSVTPIDSFTITQNNSGPNPTVEVDSKVLAGTHYAGGELTMFTHVSDPTSATLSYQWYRDDDAIPGATFETYTLTASDLTAVISVDVTASAPGYDDTAFTFPALKVGSIRATVSGAMDVDSTLTLSSRTGVPLSTFGDSITTAWYRISGSTRVPIPDADQTTYTLTGDDVGFQVVGCVTDALAYTTPSTCSDPGDVVGV